MGEFKVSIYGRLSKILVTCCLPKRHRDSDSDLCRSFLMKQSDQGLPCLLF